MMKWILGPYSMLGLGLALVTLVLDQISKIWVVRSFWPANGCDPFDYTGLFNCRVEVLPFMDFTMVWNRGISYGLFADYGSVGRILLIVFSLLAVIGFLIWLARAESRLLALSIGLIIGGALGNVIDRVLYGAVADFVSLHGFGYYWYVFNLADAAIVAGAAGLLYEVMLRPTKSP